MTRTTIRRPGRRTTRAGVALAAPALLACVLGATPVLAADAPFRAAPDVDLGADSLPRSVAVGDFDTDGRQDLAIVDTGLDTVPVRLGRGDGTFADRQEIPGFERPRDAAVADFDATASRTSSSPGTGRRIGPA
jgi:hypothetical protein